MANHPPLPFPFQTMYTSDLVGEYLQKTILYSITRQMLHIYRRIKSVRKVEELRRLLQVKTENTEKNFIYKYLQSNTKQTSLLEI